MMSNSRFLLAVLLLVTSVVVLERRASAGDWIVSTASGDIVRLPHPAGTPSTQVVAAGAGGMSSPLGITYGPDGYLYAVSSGTNEVIRFSPDGTRDCGFQWPVIPGFTGVFDLVFDPVDGNLLVSGLTCGRVVRVHPSLGAWSDEFTAYANGLLTPSALSIHPVTGRLLVADQAGNKIWEVCLTSPSLELCAFIDLAADGLSGPSDIAWKNNELYVAVATGVHRYRANNTYFDAIAPTGFESPGFTTAGGISFGPEGSLYVGDTGNARILKYGVTSAVPGSVLQGVFATGLTPRDFLFYERQSVAYPLARGTVVATYCADLTVDPLIGPYPAPHKPVLYAVDARDGGPLGRNWLAPKFWNEHATNPANVWNAANLGPVFAICLDHVGNIYVAATTAYGCFDVSVYPGGPGSVHKIDAATGAISLWLGTSLVPSIPLASVAGMTTLPNTGPGLGDITYDPGYDVFYVSNLEDGRIYTVKDTALGGVVQRAFDPFGNDEINDGTPGFPALGERVYAIHSLNPRLLLWSGWLRDRAHTMTSWPTEWPAQPIGQPANNTVFSSSVVSNLGEPVITGYVIWKVVPHMGTLAEGLAYSNPVTDITDSELETTPFLTGARILLAERTFFGDCGHLQDGMSAHQARVLEYLELPGFPFSGTSFFVGDEAFSPRDWNCAGGIAYSDDDEVWATGDALDLHSDAQSATCHVDYGLQRIPSTGNAVSPETAFSLIIDLDEVTSYYNKSQPGDVEHVEFPYDDWGDFGNLCSGDGFSFCPCDNVGGLGRGCASSVNAQGALLRASGTASLSADSVVLMGDGMPSTSSTLYFQGTTVLNGGLGVSFGDGLRCAGGAVIRLGTKTSVGGGSSYPVGGDPPVSVRGLVSAGSFHSYQLWYRNAAAFCTPATFNLTNAIGGVWAP